VSGLAWTPAGDEVWYTATRTGDYSIWGSAVGRAERRIFSAPGSLVLRDIAKDGKVLVSRSDQAVRVEGSFGGETGLRDLSWLGRAQARDISRDGTRVLLSRAGEGSGPNYDVFVRGSHDPVATRLGQGQGQQFSPDGTEALTVVHGPPSRVVILPIGPGAPKSVPTGAVQVTQARWLPDGRRLLVIGTEPSKGQRAYVTDIAGSIPRPITPEGITTRVVQVALSHDGTRVAFRSSEGVITVYSLDGQPPIAAKGFGAGELPLAWTGDDRALLVLEGEAPRRLMAVDPLTGDRKLVREMRASDASLTGPNQVYLTPDGRSYVANYGMIETTLFLAEGLR
jgi:Tol biopolymer transport system component